MRTSGTRPSLRSRRRMKRAPAGRAVRSATKSRLKSSCKGGSTMPADPHLPDAEATLLALAERMRGAVAFDAAFVGIYSGGAWLAEGPPALVPRGPRPADRAHVLRRASDGRARPFHRVVARRRATVARRRAKRRMTMQNPQLDAHGALTHLLTLEGLPAAGI